MLLQHYSYFILITLTSYSTFTKMVGRVIQDRFLILKGWFYPCKHGLLSRNKRSTVNKMKIWKFKTVDFIFCCICMVPGGGLSPIMLVCSVCNASIFITFIWKNRKCLTSCQLFTFYFCPILDFSFSHYTNVFRSQWSRIKTFGWKIKHLLLLCIETTVRCSNWLKKKMAWKSQQMKHNIMDMA